jgi:hypoxanthine phosphoribosyltransferase
MANPLDDGPIEGDHATAVRPIANPEHPFAHPAEHEFAAFLDFYRIRWQYEPTSFPLRWEDGRVV